MRIVAFARKNAGPSYHRIIMPLMLMDDDEQDVHAYVTNDLREESFEKGCDILMYNRFLPEDAWPDIERLQAKHGFKICVDIDDHWQIDPEHILYDHFRETEYARQQVEHIRKADVILTTNPRLAAEIRAINKNVHVIPNAIPRQGQFDISTEPHYQTRLFWQGSITHVRDIGVLRDPLERLTNIASKIQMVMAGYEETEPAWHTMARDYTVGHKYAYRIIGGDHVARYYAAYAHADICLVPLVRSRFNGFKSNLKVLEAANMSLPVIASQVDPYLNLPVNYCRTARDWEGHIRRLVQFPNRRKEEGQRLAAFCQEHYNFNKINNERRQILEHVAAKTEV